MHQHTFIYFSVRNLTATTFHSEVFYLHPTLLPISTPLDPLVCLHVLTGDTTDDTCEHWVAILRPDAESKTPHTAGANWTIQGSWVTEEREEIERWHSKISAEGERGSTERGKLVTLTHWQRASVQQRWDIGRVLYSCVYDERIIVAAGIRTGLGECSYNSTVSVSWAGVWE